MITKNPKLNGYQLGIKRGMYLDIQEHADKTMVAVYECGELLSYDEYEKARVMLHMISMRAQDKRIAIEAELAKEKA